MSPASQSRLRPVPAPTRLATPRRSPGIGRGSTATTELVDDPLLRYRGFLANQPAATMARADSATRARIARHLQRTHGNGFVQRLIADAQRLTDDIQRCGATPCDCSPQEHAAARAQRETVAEEEEPVLPVPPARGKGKPHKVVVHGHAHGHGRAAPVLHRHPLVQRNWFSDIAGNIGGALTSVAGAVNDFVSDALPAQAPPATTRTVRLKGETKASFNGGAFRTENVVTEPGTGCPSCSGQGNTCVHVTGDLVIDYAVTTNVTLPTMPSGLTECQRQRVQDAIDNEIAPHEQQHVDAFNAYNGTNTIHFDQTLCRNGFNDFIRGLVRTDEQPRRSSAQSASDALDPFHVDVDLNCT